MSGHTITQPVTASAPSVSPSRAEAAHGAPPSPAAQLAARITTADDPDEINWLRADLRQEMAAARDDWPAPHPAADPPPAAAPPPPAAPPPFAGPPPPGPPWPPAAPPLVPAPPLGEQEPERPRGLLGRLRRRGAGT